MSSFSPPATLQADVHSPPLQPDSTHFCYPPPLQQCDRFRIGIIPLSVIVNWGQTDTGFYIFIKTYTFKKKICTYQTTYMLIPIYLWYLPTSISIRLYFVYLDEPTSHTNKRIKSYMYTWNPKPDTSPSSVPQSFIVVQKQSHIHTYCPAARNTHCSTECWLIWH